MADALQTYLRASLPDELRVSLNERLVELEQCEFEKLLTFPLARQLFGHDDTSLQHEDLLRDWQTVIRNRLEGLIQDVTEEQQSSAFKQHFFVLLAITALQAFLQSNVTGPPLAFVPAELLFPSSITSNKQHVEKIQQNLVLSLGVDGEAAYRLTPNVELVCLADAILSSSAVTTGVKGAIWAKLRTDFVHQRLLSERAPTLQTAIYEAMDKIDEELDDIGHTELYTQLHPTFLLEQASIYTHHLMDKQAREVLQWAAKERQFEFAITGLLGKRTKFQQHDISQLVVLAKSGEEFRKDGDGAEKSVEANAAAKPENLDLNDDTLLEAISFADKPREKGTEVTDVSALPAALAALDPGSQPLLHPLDSTILLSLASSITNTSPTDGLTREETLPYAVRVLDGGSSNWQVYTQALLVRSRIEGYKSRTIERGLLQLQAVVDQVIAETTSTATGDGASTFLPRAKEAESASVSERLQYIYPLCSPTRWELEAELAARWVSLGGLRSALEIYERLEMWADAALCWAATDREDKAKRIVRRQLNHATHGPDADVDPDEETWEGPARDPPPADAPRLYCILGDISADVSFYEKAWEVSNGRYARAQRTLGRHYLKNNDYVKAAGAYSKSLKVNQLNHQSWFALGCCLLELAEFEKAVEAFSRTVQLDDTDAEAWSNLAAALLRTESPSPDPSTAASSSQPSTAFDEDADPSTPTPPHPPNPQQPRLDALRALQRAATLKHDSPRIWDNLLTVSASLSPPSYPDIIHAQSRIIALRGPTEGEKCIDVPILTMLVRHVVASEPALGLGRLVLEFFDREVVPLVTKEERLWGLVGRLAIWRGAPGQALEAGEKGWRCVVGRQGWEGGAEEGWEGVVEATVDLANAYESLGPMVREGSQNGELVAKDWRSKARMAVRGIMGRGKDSWEGTRGWDQLVECLEGLKA